MDDQVNIRVSSPDLNQLKKAELKISEKQMSGIQDEVIQYVRKNSLLKDAQFL